LLDDELLEDEEEDPRLAAAWFACCWVFASLAFCFEV